MFVYSMITYFYNSVSYITIGRTMESLYILGRNCVLMLN